MWEWEWMCLCMCMCMCMCMWRVQGIQNVEAYRVDNVICDFILSSHNILDPFFHLVVYNNKFYYVSKYNTYNG